MYVSLCVLICVIASSPYMRHLLICVIYGIYGPLHTSYFSNMSVFVCVVCICILVCVIYGPLHASDFSNMSLNASQYVSLHVSTEHQAHAPLNVPLYMCPLCPQFLSLCVSLCVNVCPYVCPYMCQQSTSQADISALQARVRELLAQQVHIRTAMRMNERAHIRTNIRPIRPGFVSFSPSRYIEGHI